MDFSLDRASARFLSLNKSPALSPEIYFPQAAAVVCYLEGAIETQSFTLDEGW